jgi:hypothetical protein
MQRTNSIIPRYLLTALLLCGFILPVSGHMHAPKKMVTEGSAPIVSNKPQHPRPASDFDGLVPSAMLF